MGAFAAATGEIGLEPLKHALQRRFSGSMAEKNIRAAERAYNLIGGAA
jgi:pyruvate ferredoxin oxidoreductase gamma subunit